MHKIWKRDQQGMKMLSGKIMITNQWKDKLVKPCIFKCVQLSFSLRFFTTDHVTMCSMYCTFHTMLMSVQSVVNNIHNISLYRKNDTNMLITKNTTFYICHLPCCWRLVDLALALYGQKKLALCTAKLYIYSMH